MNHIIIILAVLMIDFFIGAVLIFSASNNNDWMQFHDDREQEEFLREWNKKWKLR